MKKRVHTIFNHSLIFPGCAVISHILVGLIDDRFFMIDIHLEEMVC